MDSSASRGKRLKKLRLMTGLSRNELEKKYQISAATIQSWESGRYGGLTESGARLMISVFKKEGIKCSYYWLMFGAGDLPDVSRLFRF